MKTWISFLLPDDEYRERKLLYFLSEGSIILLMYLIGIFITNRYISYFQIDLEFLLFLGIWVFIGYVLIRYTISGMEYADLSTEQDYNRKLKATRVKSIGFVVFFALLSLVFMAPSDVSEWIGVMGTSVLSGLILFLIDYISIKRSYKKNKELF